MKFGCRGQISERFRGPVLWVGQGWSTWSWNRLKRSRTSGRQELENCPWFIWTQYKAFDSMANFKQRSAKESPNWLNIKAFNLGPRVRHSKKCSELHYKCLYFKTYGFSVCYQEPLVLFQHPRGPRSPEDWLQKRIQGPFSGRIKRRVLITALITRRGLPWDSNTRLLITVRSSVSDLLPTRDEGTRLTRVPTWEAPAGEQPSFLLH